MFPKIGVLQKWMVKIMENPIRMDNGKRGTLLSTFEYHSFSHREALFGELSWSAAKGAMEAAEREGLLSEEAGKPMSCHGKIATCLDMFGWYLRFCPFFANC